MQALHVLYDRDCALCRRSRRWLERQTALMPLHFVALQEALFNPVFLPLAALHPDREIIVVADTGEIWQGGAAWVMCLWALKKYRPLAGRLARPAWLPLARRVVTLISRNRRHLSDWLSANDRCEVGCNAASGPGRGER